MEGRKGKRVILFNLNFICCISAPQGHSFHPPPPLPHGRGRGWVFLGEQLARHALQRLVRADVLQEVGLGAEADAHLLDVAGRVEAFGRDDALREALALEVRLQGAASLILGRASTS